MGKLVFRMMVSADGFVAGPEGEQDWHLVGEELHRHIVEHARGMGVFLYGRRLYQMMAGYWPTVDVSPARTDPAAEFARLWREKPKVVVSRTLAEAGWNTRIARGDVSDEVTALKRAAPDVVCYGGATLGAELIRRDTVDEYHLIVHPVRLGGGTRMFPPSAPRQALALVEARTFPAGVVLLRYRKVRAMRR